MGVRLGKLQVAHFRQMTHQERLEVIRDARKQIDYIAFSQTRAGEKRRAELEARITFCEKLNRA